MRKKPIALIILDGFGYSPKVEGNAVVAAKTPNIDRYMANYPNNVIRQRNGRRPARRTDG